MCSCCLTIYCESYYSNWLLFAFRIHLTTFSTHETCSHSATNLYLCNLDQRQISVSLKVHRILVIAIPILVNGQIIGVWSHYRIFKINKIHVFDDQQPSPTFFLSQNKKDLIEIKSTLLISVHLQAQAS